MPLGTISEKSTEKSEKIDLKVKSKISILGPKKFYLSQFGNNKNFPKKWAPSITCIYWTLTLSNKSEKY